MRSVMTLISRPLAILFSILFTAALVFTLLLLNLQFTLLEAETYKRLLIEDEIYEQLPGLLAESSLLERLLVNPCTDDMLSCLDQDLQPTALEKGLEAGSPVDNPFSSASAGVQTCVREILGDETYEVLASGQRPSSPRENRKLNACMRQERREARLRNPALGNELIPLLQNFSAEQWEELIRFLLPAQELRPMTESALDEVFSYLNGETDTISISSVSLKGRLTGQAGDELIRLLLSAQPTCTAGQLAQIKAGDFENGGDTAIYCSASGEALAMVLPPMQVRVDMFISQMPDEVVLMKSNAAGIGGGSGEKALTAIRTTRKWMRLSPLLLLSLLLLVTISAVRSGKHLLRWWGIPLLIAGLVAFFIGMASQSILDWSWANHALAAIPSLLASGLGELGHSVFRSAVGELGRQIMLEAGLMILLGLALTIASAFIRHPSTPTEQPH